MTITIYDGWTHQSKQDDSFRVYRLVYKFAKYSKEHLFFFLCFYHDTRYFNVYMPWWIPMSHDQALLSLSESLYCLTLLHWLFYTKRSLLQECLVINEICFISMYNGIIHRKPEMNVTWYSANFLYKRDTRDKSCHFIQVFLLFIKKKWKICKFSQHK